MTRVATSLLLMGTCCAALAAEQPSEALRAKRLAQMKELASATRVRLVDGDEEVSLVGAPVFRYDDQPRRFLDATMWVWTENGRPVALQKVEAMLETANDARWGYCFTSLSEELVSAEWSQDRRFTAKEPGLTFQPIPGAAAPGERDTERRRQLRAMVRNFSARILTDPKEKTTAEMRLLTTPIYEYSDPNSKQLIGAVFGYSTNSTNPDMVLVLEARGAKPAWHFAAARMTTGGLTVKFRDAEVWNCEYVDFRAGPFANWHCFQTPREPEEGDAP